MNPGLVAMLLLASAIAGGPVPEAWVVEGRVSGNPHAHPIEGARGNEVVYVDTVANGQLVAYVSGEHPPEGAWVRLHGTVLAFEASSKRPGSTKKFPVKQLEVERVEPLPGSDRVQALVDDLGRDDLSRDEKQDAQTAIYKAGIDAFPVLIANLENGRIYEKNRDVRNYMGMPAKGPRPKPLLANVTVGSVCRELLHRLLTPAGYRSPKERVFKPRGEMFLVDDWQAWWLRHREKSLAQIHDELKPLVDRYFETGGDSQKVP